MTHPFVNEFIKEIGEFGFARSEPENFYFNKLEEFKIEREDQNDPKGFIQEALAIMRDVYGEEYQEHIDEIFYPMQLEGTDRLD